jgi:hypothetical protein
LPGIAASCEALASFVARKWGRKFIRALEIANPNSIRDASHGFLLWFALFLQCQALFSFVRSEDKNSLNQTGIRKGNNTEW